MNKVVIRQTFSKHLIYTTLEYEEIFILIPMAVAVLQF